MKKTVQFITMLALVALAFAAGIGTSAADKEEPIDLCSLFSFKVTETKIEEDSGTMSISVSCPDLSEVISSAVEKIMSSAPVIPTDEEITKILSDKIEDIPTIEKEYEIPMVREDSAWKIDESWEQYDEFVSVLSGRAFGYEEESGEEETEEETKKDPITSCEVIYTSIEQGVTSFGDVWLDVISVVKNTGTTNLYMDSAKFDIEDSCGTLVDTEDYVSPAPQVIKPGETSVYQSCFTVDNGDKDEKYSASFSCDAKEATVSLIRFPVHDVTLSKSNYGDINVVGRVENNLDEKESARICVILYDKNDNVIGVIRASEYNIAPGQKTSFKASSYGYHELDFKDIARYEVFAYPYQYQW